MMRRGEKKQDKSKRKVRAQRDGVRARNKSPFTKRKKNKRMKCVFRVITKILVENKKKKGEAMDRSIYLSVLHHCTRNEESRYWKLRKQG